MGQQVRRMGEIYAEARKTISWLGCETSTTARDVPNLGESLRLIEERVSLRRHAVEDFFAQLPNWTTIMNSIAARWQNYPYFPKESRWNEDRFPKASREVQQLGMGKSGPALVKVLSLPYWTRVWIVQEVALGNNVKLTFGSVSIDFEVFFLAYKCYVYHEAKSLGIQKGLTRATKVAIQARAAVADRDISMLRILQWGRHCESTNIVDRIYGLLGFLKFHEVGASSTFQSLEVDYNRDVALVFWDVVFAFRGSTAGIEAIKHEAYFMDQLVEFAELLPDLARSLHCSFSEQSLQRYLGNEDDPPPEKQMAQLATRMVSIVRAVGRGIVRVRSDSLRLEPSRLSARFLQSLRNRRGLSSGSVQADLATIFLEYADCDGVDERERLNVALIALEIASLEDFECRKWSCMPAPVPPGKDNLNDDGERRKMEFQVRWRRSGPVPAPDTRGLCSLADQANRHEQPEVHQCHASRLFLDLPDPGLNLSLRSLNKWDEDWIYGMFSIIVDTTTSNRSKSGPLALRDANYETS